MTDFVYGLHPASALSNADYHALDAVGKSDLDLIARSPLHWKQRAFSREETSAMRLGSAVHCAVLEPGAFENRYVQMPQHIDRRTKAGKDEYAEFLAAHDGKHILGVEDMDLCLSVADAVRSHPRAAALLSAGQPEVSALWKDPGFSVRCRARFDWITPDGLLLDLKTTQDASPRGFAKSCANFRYHVQAAWYLDAYQAATGDLPMGFVFIAVEKTAPYAVALYELDAEAIELGRMTAFRDLARYANAREFDTWPGYAESIQPLSLPRWALTAEIEE